MPKPTSTALNVNDNFSHRDFNPQYGDPDSQDEVTLKSSIASTSAARPARPEPAGANAADDTEGETTSSASIPITITVYPAHFDPSSANVSPGDMVTLQSGGKTNQSVCTYWNGTSTDVFTSGTRPYPANGTTYMLDPKFQDGSIALAVATSDPCPTNVPGVGANGMINVGGKPTEDGGGDDDGSHSRA